MTWFLWHFFSFKLLLTNLFAPFKRMGEAREARFEPSQWIAAFIINSIMRAVGLALRASLLSVGGVVLLLVFLSLPILMLIWLILPLVVVLSFLFGLGLFLEV